MYNLKSLQVELVFCRAVGFRCLFWRMLGATCQVDQQPYSLRQAAQSLVLHYGLLETQRILKEIETAEQGQVKFTLLHVKTKLISQWSLWLHNIALHYFLVCAECHIQHAINVDVYIPPPVLPPDPTASTSCDVAAGFPSVMEGRSSPQHIFPTLR